MYTVFIRELEFYGFHGVPDEEQVVGHRYRVSLTLEVDGTADVTDLVAETVDYGAVVSLVGEVGRGQKFRTMERLARVLGEAVLGRFALVFRLEVCVSKPLPPVDAIVEEAGVRIVLGRKS